LPFDGISDTGTIIARESAPTAMDSKRDHKINNKGDILF
jgi:hypothetical protein